jgi:integrase
MASIERRKEGSRTYYVARYRTPDDKSRKQRFATRGAAQSFLNGVEHSKTTGDFVDPHAGKITFEAWVKEYQQTVEKRPTTMARDAQVLRTWFVPAFGKKQLGSITPAHVRAVVAKMREKLAPKTVRTNYGVLRAVMNAAVEAEKLRRSPCRAVQMPEETATQPRFLSVDEIAALAEAIGDEHRALVYVAAVVGLRWSECAGLRVGSCNFLKRTISVHETIAEVEGAAIVADVKSRASRRTIAVPAPVMELLSAHLARRGRPGPDELVFVAPDGGSIRPGNFRNRVWQPACVKAGLGTITVDKRGNKHYDGLTFHGLRHTSAGLMIALQTHPRVMQQRLGHASIRTTLDVYGSVLPEVDERVTDGLAELLTSTTVDTAANASG